VRAAGFVLLGLVATVACYDRAEPSEPVESEAEVPDQVMDSMSFRVTRSDVLLSEVSADTARVYNARQEMQLTRLTMVFFDSTGRERSRVTADSGVYDIRSGTLDARGNVIVVTPPPTARTLRTSHLLYDKTAAIIEVDTAYTWESAEGRGSGASFTSTTDFRELRQLRPRATQKGDGILLPGTAGDTP
jgi:LPS export ABC transporter protein LptC